MPHPSPPLNLLIILVHMDFLCIHFVAFCSFRPFSTNFNIRPKTNHCLQTKSMFSLESSFYHLRLLSDNAQNMHAFRCFRDVVASSIIFSALDYIKPCPKATIDSSSCFFDRPMFKAEQHRITKSSLSSLSFCKTDQHGSISGVKGFS